MKKRLLVLGESYMNIQMKTNSPKTDEDVTYGSSYGFHPYGAGAATAIAAAKLGGECIFCTKLGNDPYGERMRSYYKSCGLHLYPNKFADDAQTGLSVTIYQDNSNGHTYITKGANLTFTKKEIDEAFDFEPNMFIIPQEDVLSQLKESEIETVSVSDVPQPTVAENTDDTEENVPEDFSETIMFSSDEITAELDAARNEPKNLVVYAAKKAVDLKLDIIAEYTKYTSKLPLRELNGIKILVISDTMLEEFSGIKPAGVEKTLQALIPLAAKIKSKYYVVQLGNDSSFIYDGKYFEVITLPAMLKAKAKQENTSMHGTYIGALAARFLETRDIVDSCKYAGVVSILTRSKFGCLDHIPSQEEIKEFTSEK